MSESICSNMTQMTVSAFGEEMPIEQALDNVFKEIQEHINELHVSIRNLCMTQDRGESYIYAYQYYHDITTHITEGAGLFKELKSVMKQILPKRPKGLIKTFEKDYNPERDYEADETGLYAIKE